MKEVKNKLSTRIRELREEKGLLQSQLATQLNFTQTTISKWELGDREPNADTIILLAQFFGVTTDYLLGIED